MHHLTEKIFSGNKFSLSSWISLCNASRVHIPSHILLDFYLQHMRIKIFSFWVSSLHKALRREKVDLEFSLSSITDLYTTHLLHTF
ncbi:hypothetical protein RchiOBHm_Chr5g0037481 [Rosa chinensis]|uniref:Uncharacterized protein n=1 Tax=Rosa chinensis TaxID=74649 RepID=A0A2P6QBQ9_ROSCH|nr:hypothetical protein RchiOBHm_Chr5g0037481 [Rosa chinensis]